MFVLYIEGPRDRDVLQVWARKVDPPLGRALGRRAVILGGRQPERAATHFSELRRREAGVRGLCILDRDGGNGRLPDHLPGLEYHVWSRRHIESYLLVPEAIRRSLRLPTDDPRVARACRRVLPGPDDEGAWRDLDAKRLLGRDGELSLALGLPLRAGRIARSMREEEIHPEVRGLLARARSVFRGASREDILGG